MPKPIVACIPTMPTRSHSLPAALASVIDQVDRLYLYLDGFLSVPEIARSDDKIIPVMSSEFAGLHCDGKFVGMLLEDGPCYYLGPDDDIIYPQTYVSDLMDVVDQHDGHVIAGVHGGILNSVVSSYNKHRKLHHFQKPLDAATNVDILGTGTALFDTEHFRFDVRKWPHRNVTDLLFAIEAERQGVKRIAVRRQENYLRCIESNQSDSLYAQLCNDDTLQTRLANELLELLRKKQSHRSTVP